MAWERSQNGFVRRGLEAEAARRRRQRVDLDAAPPDPGLLREAGFEAYAREQTLPWRRLRRGVVWVAANPERVERLFNSAHGAAPEVRRADPAAIDRALRQRFGTLIAESAAVAVPRELSARSGAAAWQIFLIASLLWGALILAITAPIAAWTALVVGLTALVAVTGALRAALLTVVLRSARRPRPAVFAQPLILPSFALLAPLAREAAAVPALIDALMALDYPKDRLRRCC